ERALRRYGFDPVTDAARDVRVDQVAVRFVHIEAAVAAVVVVELGFVRDRLDEPELLHRREKAAHRLQSDRLALRREIRPPDDIRRVSLGTLPFRAAQRAADEARRERAAERDEELDTPRVAVLAGQLPQRVVCDDGAQAMTDEADALAGEPGLADHGLQQRTDLARDAVLVAEVPVHLGHRQPELGPGDQASDERQRVADQMREPARAARRRIDLGAILVARLGLMQKPFDTRQVERDVAIAAVEAMRPRDEREPILVLAQPARRRGTDPREAGDERSQQLALV